MGRFLRLIGRLIALPFVVTFAMFLTFMGLEVRDPSKRREDERERRPENRMQISGDQDDDDKRRRWQIDRKDADAFGAVIGATADLENTFEPSIDKQTWEATRKLRRIGAQEAAAYAGV